ncbi:hypothetical protein RRG08_024530 [Elysia crispata]|uniref:Uncharacterized protein n=1 Tax=Elysia crispata TaxID=231223 RepID=A0AAE0Y7I0_9GAST|nr:hypothetical protein RRG08_024530 [Elysia crispata]
MSDHEQCRERRAPCPVGCDHLKQVNCCKRLLHQWTRAMRTALLRTASSLKYLRLGSSQSDELLGTISQEFSCYLPPAELEVERKGNIMWTTGHHAQ